MWCNSQVRFAAQKKGAHTDFLKLTDELRDVVLPGLGVRIEDKTEGQPSVWKLENAADLLRQIEEKKSAADANALKKVSGVWCVCEARDFFVWSPLFSQFIWFVA
jgi:hypothetical protein